MTLLTSFDFALSTPCESTADNAKYHVPGVNAIVRCNVDAPLTETVCVYVFGAVP